MFKSLKHKMILMICLLLLFSLASLSVVSYLSSTKHLKESLDMEAALSAANVALEVNSFFDTKIAKVESVGKLISGDKAEDLKLIQRAQEQNPEYETFFFSYDLTGKNVINFLGETTDVSDRVHYMEAGKGEGKIVVSEPVQSKRTGNNIVTMILPLMKDGKQYGYMGSTIPIDEVQNTISTVQYGETGYAYLLSKVGTVIWHPNAEYVLTSNVNDIGNPAVISSFEQVKNGQSGVFEYELEQGEYTGSYTPTSLGWGVFVTAPEEELHHPIHELTEALIVASVLSLLVTAVFAYLFTVRLVRPIQLLNAAVKEVAEGNLSKTIQVKGRDEVAVLTRDFNQTVTHLKHLVEGVTNSSGHVQRVTQVVSNGMTQALENVNVIGSSVQQIAEGAETHASSSQEIAVSMSDMASGVIRIAETSSMVSEAAQEAAGHAESGSEVVDKAVRQIGNIGEGTDKVGTAVERLSDRSQQIETILNFITGITSQIRLLSLNASIEAARAGEHGRGFGVVAEEVKKLAGQSEESTDRIAQLITEIREDTLTAVQMMDVSRKDVQAGIELIEDVREKFDHILHATRNVADHILEVSAASEEMSAGSEQVSASVEELKHIATLTSRDANHAAEAVENQVGSIDEISHSVTELSAVVENLRQELTKFKL